MERGAGSRKEGTAGVKLVRKFQETCNCKKGEYDATGKGLGDEAEHWLLCGAGLLGAGGA